VASSVSGLLWCAVRQHACNQQPKCLWSRLEGRGHMQLVVPGASLLNLHPALPCRHPPPHPPPSLWLHPPFAHPPPLLTSKHRPRIGCQRGSTLGHRPGGWGCGAGHTHTSNSSNKDSVNTLRLTAERLLNVAAAAPCAGPTPSMHDGVCLAMMMLNTSLTQGCC
jgi:hypothetical protein